MSFTFGLGFSKAFDVEPVIDVFLYIYIMKNKLRILSFYIGVNILGIPNITTHIIEDKKNKHYENHIHTTSNTSTL